MTAALDTMSFSPRTRTGNEAFIYYNLGKAITVGRIVKTADSSVYVPESSCAAALVLPDEAFLVARVARYEGTTDLVITIAEADTVTIPAGSPIGYSAELINPAPALDSFTGYTMTGGSTGDTVDLVALPGTDDDTLICYDRGFQANPGDSIRPIARKFNPVDHFVTQRPENSINLTELVVSNAVGLRKLRGKDITLIIKLFPDGTGVPCEIQYYTNCRLNIPFEIPAEGNDSLQIQATGYFNKDLIFAAPVA